VKRRNRPVTPDPCHHHRRHQRPWQARRARTRPTGSPPGVIARSTSKIDELRGEIEEIAPGTPVESFVVDLSLLRDVRRIGQVISARYDRISVLINNAGVHAFSQRVTPEGFAEMSR